MNTPTNKSPEILSKSERVFLTSAALASGLVLGAMLAHSESSRIKDAAFSQPFLIKTGGAFLIGFVVPFAYLTRILLHRDQTSRWFARGGLMANIILVVITYVYALRIDQSIERLLGFVAALSCVAAGVTVIRFIVRAAEREEVEEEAKEHAGSDDAASHT